MRTLSISIAVLAAALAAPASLLNAQEPEAEAPVAEAPAPDEPADAGPIDTDPFNLAISAGRYGVLLDRAMEGLIIGPPAMTLDEDPDPWADAAARTRRAVISFLILRERACEYRVVAPEHCEAFEAPAWLGEAPDATPDAVEINARLTWLTDRIWPFIEAGCDAGQSRQDDEFPNFCAVE